MKGQLKPWMHPQELAVLGSLLHPTDRVIEFGSGGSTIWLAERVSEVHSIEHDVSWADRVKSCAPQNVRIYTQAPNWPYTGAASEPGQFSKYLSVSATIGGSWDAAFVDGRARIEATLSVCLNLKPGSWLFFHDWFVRPRYTERIRELLPFFELVENLSVKDTPQTLAIFRRLSSNANL